MKVLTVPTKIALDNTLLTQLVGDLQDNEWTITELRPGTLEATATLTDTSAFASWVQNYLMDPTHKTRHPRHEYVLTVSEGEKVFECFPLTVFENQVSLRLC